jgi:hypothetical protein
MTTNPLKSANAFMIGAAKSGTTTIFAVLRDYSQVCFPNKKKEPTGIRELEDRGKTESI